MTQVYLKPGNHADIKVVAQATVKVDCHSAQLQIQSTDMTTYDVVAPLEKDVDYQITSPGNYRVLNTSTDCYCNVEFEMQDAADTEEDADTCPDDQSIGAEGTTSCGGGGGGCGGGCGQDAEPESDDLLGEPVQVMGHGCPEEPECPDPNKPACTSCGGVKTVSDPITPNDLLGVCYKDGMVYKSAASLFAEPVVTGMCHNKKLMLDLGDGSSVSMPQNCVHLLNTPAVEQEDGSFLWTSADGVDVLSLDAEPDLDACYITQWDEGAVDPESGLFCAPVKDLNHDPVGTHCVKILKPCDLSDLPDAGDLADGMELEVCVGGLKQRAIFRKDPVLVDSVCVGGVLVHQYSDGSETPTTYMCEHTIDTDTWSTASDNGDGTYSLTMPDGSTITWNGEPPTVDTTISVDWNNGAVNSDQTKFCAPALDQDGNQVGTQCVPYTPPTDLPKHVLAVGVFSGVTTKVNSYLTTSEGSTNAVRTANFPREILVPFTSLGSFTSPNHPTDLKLLIDPGIVNRTQRRMRVYDWFEYRVEVNGVNAGTYTYEQYYYQDERTDSDITAIYEPRHRPLALIQVRSMIPASANVEVFIQYRWQGLSAQSSAYVSNYVGGGRQVGYEFSLRQYVVDEV